MGKIRWTEKASKNLQAIHEYIAKDSETYAIRFIKSLIRSTAKLESLPHCGRKVPELEDFDFKEVIYQNYRIVYRVVKNSEDVEILAVIHGTREIKTAFRKEWEVD